jgi:sulfate transport system ATP-binding protein
MSEPSDAPPMTISIRAVEKRFGRYPALNGVSLEIRHGELLALLGPSGSGKTTLLRLIAGLEFPDRGQVLFDRDEVTYLHAAARQVGFVFQQYALFKHMTVARNVAFGLDVRRKNKPPRAEITRRVDDLLKLVELDGMGPRYPSQLSGGQRQRVALARALAVSPRVLLLDEPFGALDATVRKSLRRELRRIHDATGVTTIFVTHDQEEALELADRVAILNHGRIEQIGTPAEVHDHPASAFVCGFVGEANRFEGKVARGLFTAGPITAPAMGVADGAAVAFIRPHDLVIAAAGGGFETHVARVIPQGATGRVEAETADGRWIEVDFARDQLASLAPGAVLKLSVKQAHVFPATQG